MRLLPSSPPPGPFRREWWRSPLRGPWLASVLGSALLPLLFACTVTGFVSRAAYSPDAGANDPIPDGGLGFDLYAFDWPTAPAWLFAAVQGVHVVTGIAAIPILLAKLWAVVPKLFEWPPLRSIAHALERLTLALLVGSSLFVFLTGVLNIQVYYPWAFSFVPAHYYGAFIFVSSLVLHVALKLGTVRRAFREHGVLAPLREGIETTRAHPADEHSTAPVSPAAPTISRRGLLATVGAGSLALLTATAGQSIGGPFRSLALFAPRGTGADRGGANGFPINKTAAARGITAEETGAGWRLELEGARRLALSRSDLLALPQHTEELPIACVEGWTTTQTWSGVRIADLARLAGASDGEVVVESLQRAGAFRSASLTAGQVADPRSLLALRVNGEDLSLDHGFPARIIAPALPGVLCTKWVGRMMFGERA